MKIARVEPIERAAVGAEQGTRVLGAGVALDKRLEQVSDRAQDRDRNAQDQRIARGSSRGSGTALR